ncbi:MAG: hypothetical protein WBM86_28160 [Waterburya sp.]
MTLEPSNHILSMVGTDIDKILLKACLVNWYLYCPYFAMPLYYLVDQTDLLWGNSLAGADHPDTPKSIHQKYWIELYRDIYPVTLVEKDWLEEIKKIIALQPTKIAAPEITRSDPSNLEPEKNKKPQGFKRSTSEKKSKSLF